MAWSHASWLRAAGTTAVVLVAGWGAFVAGQPPTAGRSRRRRSTARARVGLGAAPLQRGQAAPAAGAHAAQGAGQPGQRRLGLPRHRRGPHPHQLSRRQRGGAAAGPLSSGLQHRRSRAKARCSSSRFDAIHDLAVVKPVDPAPLAGRGGLRFRPRDRALAQGERIYSLGNPLDVGFAVIEGTYNGLVERSFYPTDLLLRLAQSRRQRRADARRARAP